MRKNIRYFVFAFAAVWSVSIAAQLATGSQGVDLKKPASTDPTEETHGRKISVLIDGVKQEMALDDYLVGVILQEVPADFHPEAKKAQAVVSRTYALRVAEKGTKHGPGTVCGESACCQAYISPEEYVQKWGVQEPVKLAREAVQQTQDVVLCYGGELIDATFFACSGGLTEDAVAVWGSDVPYLQSVESPGEENADAYISSAKFSAQEFCDAIGRQLEGYPASWFGEISYTKGGGVERIWIGGNEYSGIEVRMALGLRSTNFTITAMTDSIHITTKGFGHRVGMSQYGAEAMAISGSGYSQILKHYYSGVSLESIEQ